MNCLKCLFAYCLAVCGTTMPAEAGTERAFAIVGRMPGVLAVQEASDKPWRVIHSGGILPDVAEIRTSADSPCQIFVESSDIVVLGPLSRVKFDLTTRRIQLLSGRLFSLAPPVRSWNIFVGETRVDGTGAGFQASFDGGHVIQVSAFQGIVNVTVPGSAPVTLKEMTSQTWVDTHAAKNAVPLTPDQRSRFAAWSTPLPPSQGLGQLIITDSQSRTQRRLTLARYHAELVVSRPVLLVKLDQAFYNPSAVAQDGEFVMNLPPGASVSRFAVSTSPTEFVEGQIIDRRLSFRDSAEDDLTQRHSTILERIGDHLFKMRVSPINANDITRILLDYTLPFHSPSDKFHVQLPLLSDLEPIWDFRVDGVILGSTPLSSVRSPTHPEVQFAARGTNEIRFRFARRHYRPTTDFLLTFQQSAVGKSTTFRRHLAEPLKLAKDPSTQEEGIFVIPDPTGGVTEGQDHWNDYPATYFLADVPIPAVSAATGPADVLILLETSSSLKTVKRLQPALQMLVKNLRSQDRVRLVCVDAVPRPLHDGWLKSGSTEATQALALFDQQICIGANDILAACRSVASQFETEATVPRLANVNAEQPRRRIVVYLGEGRDTIDRRPQSTQEQVAQDCQAVLAQAQADFWAVEVVPSRPVSFIESKMLPNVLNREGQAFFQVCFTCLANQQVLPKIEPRAEVAFEPCGRPLLKAITDGARGRLFDIADKPLDQARFFEWVLAGAPSATAIVDVNVTSAEQNGDRAEDLYFTRNVLPGDPLRITGRIAPTSKLKFEYGVKPVNAPMVLKNLEMTAASDVLDHLVGRYWAERRYEHLYQILVVTYEQRRSALALDAIVRLSREWSLLTPFTAFKISTDTKRKEEWIISFQGRRSYWPDTDQPVVALTSDWITSAAPESVVKAHRFALLDGTELLAGPEAIAFAKARTANFRTELSKGRLDAAERTLSLIRSSMIEETPDYSQLAKELQDARRHVQALREFGVRRDWFQAAARHSLPLSLDSYLASVPSIPQSLLRRHPHAETLLQEVDFQGGEMSLEEFAKVIKARTGIQVLINKQKLEGEKLKSIDTPITVPNLERMTWFSVFEHVLGCFEVGYVEHPHSFEITSLRHANEPKLRRFFDVQDLQSPQPRFDLRELRDPLLDRLEAAEKQIQDKLRETVSLKFVDASLEEVVTELGRKLKANIVIRRGKLNEDAISTETTDFQFESDSVPVGDALRWILQQQELTFAVRDEALVITTKTDANRIRPLRVYPAAGLFHFSQSGLIHTHEDPLWNDSSYSEKTLIPANGLVDDAAANRANVGPGGFFGTVAPEGGERPKSQRAGVTVQTTGISEFSDSRFVSVARELSVPGTSAELAELDFDAQVAATELHSMSHRPASKAQLREAITAQVRAIMSLTGGEEKGSPWQQISGEGGDIGFFAPCLAFPIRQTVETHAEIADYFRDQRLAQARQGIKRGFVPMDPAQIGSMFESLDSKHIIRLIMMLTGGEDSGSPWMRISGEGGDLTWDEERSGLHVSQSIKALDEVSWLLLKLRRERYASFHKSRPWEEKVTRPTSSFSLVPGEWTAGTSITKVADRNRQGGQVTPEELALLKVRRQLASGNWSWTDGDGQSRFTLSMSRSDDGRLRLVWPGREIRVSGQLATAVAPAFQFAEIGTWGESVRQWLDVEIPFWPHRSNQELAELYDITLVNAPQKDRLPSQLQTLRFVPIEFRNLSTWIDISFDVSSGLPVEWVAVSQSQVRRRFTITSGSTATHREASGSLDCHSTAGGTGHWSVATGGDVIASEIFDPTNLPSTFMVLDRRVEASGKPEPDGFLQLKNGSLSQAVTQFRAQLQKSPNQPLIKFLLAWSLDHQSLPATREEIRAAYLDAVRSGPAELSSYVTENRAGRLSSRDIALIFNEQPVESHTVHDRLKLASWFLQAGFTDKAADLAEAAWNMKPESEAIHFEILCLLVDAKLHQSDFAAAIQFVEQWMGGKADRPVIQIKQLLSLFETQGVANRAFHIYDKVQARADVQQLPAVARRELYLWHAHALRPYKDLNATRWNSLHKAYSLLPASQSDAGNREIFELVAEIREDSDAKPEFITSLLTRTTIASHRLTLRLYWPTRHSTSRKPRQSIGNCTNRAFGSATIWSWFSCE